MRLPINKRISYLGVLLAFCLILGFLEGMLPLILLFRELK